MARPQKQTVDYFPHMAISGKTMSSIEDKFGNDGYVFFFKLLEYLCDSDGHFIDCMEPGEWDYLLAKTRVKTDVALDIINLLVDWNKLDHDLWKKGIIWYQSLVDNIADAYKNRKKPTPSKPEFSERKEVSICRNPENREIIKFLPVETIEKEQKEGQSTPDNPHIILNEIKLDEIKVYPSPNDTLAGIDTGAASLDLNNFDDRLTWFKNLLKALFPPEITENMLSKRDLLISLVETYNQTQLEDGVARCRQYTGKSLQYIKSILVDIHGEDYQYPWDKPRCELCGGKGFSRDEVDGHIITCMCCKIDNEAG